MTLIDNDLNVKTKQQGIVLELNCSNYDTEIVFILGMLIWVRFS